MKTQNENPFFSPNGRILIKPFKVEKNTSGNDSVIISYYTYAGVYTYSIQAQMQKRIFAKHPHPHDEIFLSIAECNTSAFEALKIWCDQNRLKKCFNRLVPPITMQLSLFDFL